MSGLKSLAKELAKKGRDGDTMLAHINPFEAEVLKALGGSGTINPHTGLPEFSKWWRNPSAFVEEQGHRAIDAVEDTASQVGDAVVSALRDVGSGITQVFDKIQSTVQAIINDPLPIIAQYVGSAFGIPPFVTAAAITAARGGDIGDMVKSAAVSYAVSYGAQNVDLGFGPDAVSEFGENYKVPQTFTDITKQIGLSVGEGTTQTIGNMAAAALNNSVIAGVTAGLTGKDITAAMTSGAISGSVSAGTVSLTNELGLQKDWGLSNKTMTLINKTISTGLSGAISGKDPTQTIINYIADSVVKAGVSEFATEAKNAYKEYTALSNTLKPKQETYDADLKDWQTQQQATQKEIDGFNGERTKFMDNWSKNMQPILDKVNGYNSTFTTAKAEYDSQMAIYNDTNQSVDTRNAAGAAAEAQAKIANDAATTSNNYQTANKATIDSYANQNTALSTKATDLNGKVALLSDYTTGAPSASNKDGSAAWQLYQSSQDLQKTLDATNAASTTLDAAQTKYNTHIAEVTSNRIFEEGVLNGTIKPVDNPDGKPGLVYFNNGSVLDAKGGQLLTADGKSQYTTIKNPVSEDILSGIVTNESGKVTYAGTEGRGVTAKDITNAQDIASGKYSQDLSYDINKDNKVDASDVKLIKALSQGANFNPEEEAQPWQFLGTSGEGFGDWRLTKEGYWITPDGQMLDMEGNAIGYNAPKEDYEVQPWENLSKSGEINNMSGWAFDNGVWTDPNGNKFDLYGNVTQATKDTTKPFKGSIGTTWGPTGGKIATTLANQAKAATQAKQQQISKARTAAGIMGLMPQIDLSVPEEQQQPQVVGSGVLPDTEKPEFTNPIGLADPLETDYFSKLVKAEQDKKDAQKLDNTVKIASKNDVVEAASGGRVGLLGLLHRRG